MSKKIYVASSWRNTLQPGIVHALRRCGHDVYDFRNPEPGNAGFSWRSIHPDWENWTPAQYREALQHPIAKAGYKLDIDALHACDAVVLVLPSGRSASWEFGYAISAGKPGYVVLFDAFEPELMYREATLLTTMDELFDAFDDDRLLGPARADAPFKPSAFAAHLQEEWETIIAIDAAHDASHQRRIDALLKRADCESRRELSELLARAGLASPSAPPTR